MLVRVPMVLMSYSTRVMQPIMKIKSKTTIITISYLPTIKLRTSSQHHPLPSQLSTLPLPIPPIPPPIPWPIFAPLRYRFQTTTSLHYHPQPLPKVTPPPPPLLRRWAKIDHDNGHIHILLLLPHEGESLRQSDDNNVDNATFFIVISWKYVFLVISLQYLYMYTLSFILFIFLSFLTSLPSLSSSSL